MNTIMAILSIGFNQIESKVFDLYFLHEKHYDYLGNFDASTANIEHQNRPLVILINLRLDNAHPCARLIQTLTQGYPCCKVVLFANTFSAELGQLLTAPVVSTYLIKPTTKGVLFSTLDPLFDKNNDPPVDPDISKQAYLKFLTCFEKMDQKELFLKIEQICQTLIPPHQPFSLKYIKDCQTFATQFYLYYLDIIPEENQNPLLNLYKNFLSSIIVTQNNQMATALLRDHLQNFYKIVNNQYLSVDYHRIQSAKKKIQKAIDQCQDFSLESIAAELYISSYYLSRLFLKIEHTNFKDYVIYYRLDKAKALLRGTNFTIEKIGLQCGYREASSFSRAFKKQFSLSPNAYRRQCLDKPLG